MSRPDRGFTLIEVLVAATILFSVITMVSLLFRSSFIASEKAQVRVEQTGVLPTLLNLVQNELRVQASAQTSELEGEGLIWEIPYQWQATLIEFKSPVDKFDAHSGVMDEYPPRYQLWQVSLLIGTGQSALQYQYQEFSWID